MKSCLLICLCVFVSCLFSCEMNCLFAQFEPPEGFENFPSIDKTPSRKPKNYVRNPNSRLQKNNVNTLTIRELTARMYTPVDTTDFPDNVKMQTALVWLQEKLKAKGKPVPIVINAVAFIMENPDAPPIEETIVSLPKLKTLPLCKVLQLLSSQIITQNGTFLLRPYYVEITSWAESGPYRLMEQKVFGVYLEQPLWSVLNDLYEKTAVPVTVDVRQAHKLQKRISANFVTGCTLNNALRILTDMADLRVVVLDNAIYVTSPDHAIELILEQQWHGWHGLSYQPFLR